MNCADIQALLPDYLGDELSPKDRRNVDDHLSACASCHDEVQSLLRAVDSMRLLDAPATLETQVTRHGQKVMGDSTRRWRKLSIWGHGLAYAAVLIAGLAIGWSAKPGSNADGSQSDALLDTPMVDDGDRRQPDRALPANRARELESLQGRPLLRNAMALSQAFTQHRSR